MSTVALKRGAAPPKRKPAKRQTEATVALPMSAPILRRNVVLAGLGLAAAIMVIAASLAGIPQRLWTDFVRQSADAGFEVRHVEISGTKEMGKLPIYDAALAGDTNAMLTADLTAIRARLLALPWVADASVGRRLPDTLSIQIVERRPVALWQHRQRFTAIDITGQPLTTHKLERFAKLPVVVGPGANTRVRELLALTASAPNLSNRVDAAVLVGGRRWDVKFKSGETLALPDTPAAATAAFKKFASMEASLGEDRKLLGGRFQRFDMRLPGQMTVGGPAVQQALEAQALAAAKAARAAKPTTI
nr:FtsQ-type POTRA domain-containing protein [Polymorphobacter sp.]